MILKVLLCLLPALFLAQRASGETISTQCGAEERSKSFLETAVEFINKAKDSIPHCHTNSKCHRKPVDCEEIFQCGNNKSGVYWIWPRNKIVSGSVEVYCDMATDQGGWTVFQRRGNYSRPNDYFFKEWAEYKNGFGDIEKDFWLGNDLIFSLSNQRLYSLRVDLKDVEGNTRYALYDTFWIDNEDEQYKLHVKDYSGDAGDSLILWHNDQKFSTKDKDNDLQEGSCAQTYKGGWWYKNCHASNLNGLYLRGKHDSYADGVVWTSWKGHHESMDTTELKIRPKDFHITN